MSSLLLHIADRVIGRPLLITPEKAEIIFGVLQGRMGFMSDLVPTEPEASRFVGQPVNSKGDRKMLMVQEGVGIVSITGSLVNRGAWIGANSGMTSYEGIQAQLADAAKDDSIHSVILDLNSPGGEAGGMIGTAAAVRQLATTKHVVAVVNDMAASAAYGIASAAHEIVASPSSVVGSIGVVLLHLDRSEELHKKGINPTLIHAGAHKVDGNPFGPLSKAVKDDLQAEVNKIYDLFLETVAQGRGGRLSRESARGTEARVFMGQDAVMAGLADRIGSFEAELASLSRAKSAVKPVRGIGGMSMSTNEGAAQAAGNVPAAVAPGVDANAVKARIKAITTSSSAKGREDLASHLAFDTELSVDAAIAILDKSPRAEAAPAPAAAPVAPAAGAYAEAKADAGALGVAPVETRAEGSDVKSLWSKAVAGANQRFAS
jgi:signal peptide peptidase SppA